MRFGITLTGLVLAACGISALCLGLGIAGAGSPDRPVLGPGASGFVADHPWFWPALAGAGVSLALIGLLWLLAQAHAAVAHRFALTDRTTRALARTAAPALTDTMMEVPGVQDVRARLTGPAARPRFVVSVLCDEAADLAPLRTRIDESAHRLRLALESPELPLTIRLRLVHP